MEADSVWHKDNRYKLRGWRGLLKQCPMPAGQRALAAVSRAVDGRGPNTDLVSAACAFCEVDTAADLLRY